MVNHQNIGIHLANIRHVFLKKSQEISIIFPLNKKILSVISLIKKMQRTPVIYWLHAKFKLDYRPQRSFSFEVYNLKNLKIQQFKLTNSTHLTISQIELFSPLPNPPRPLPDLKVFQTFDVSLSLQRTIYPFKRYLEYI